MKTAFFVLLGISLAVTARAQTGGQVIFANDANSLVINGLTGAPITATNPPIRVMMYVAPAGTTDESAFLAITSSVYVGLSGPGRYNGGTRTIPFFPPGTPLAIQVRAWEYTYGNSYEAALAALPMNGRRAFVGKSAIGIITPTTAPAIPPTVGAIVGPITVWPLDDVPYLTANDIAVSEGSNGVAAAIFTVQLLTSQTQTVTVDFTTQDGSALAGSDYVATNGTLVFLPGELSKQVPVRLLPDAAAESEENFTLVLGNPGNATLLRSVINCLVVEVRITGISIDTSVSFNTLSGRRYMLEKSADGVNWSPVPGVTNSILGNGSIVTVIDRGSGCQSMSLYRASLLPQ